MALSIIGLNVAPEDRIVRILQAANPEEMAALLADALAEITALNATIEDPFQKFQPADACLAGGGDGHTFTFTIIFVRAECNRVINVILCLEGGASLPNTTVDGTLLPPSAFFSRFFMASQSEALQPLMTAALDEVAASNQGGSLCVNWQIAGASGGTRFMGVVTGLNITIPEPP